jgi:hypothetical protein
MLEIGKSSAPVSTPLPSSAWPNISNSSLTSPKLVVSPCHVTRYSPLVGL